MPPKPPWSVRKNPESVEEFCALKNGIPDGLMNSLLGFLEPHFLEFHSFAGSAGYKVRTERTERFARIMGRSFPTHSANLLVGMFSEEEDLLLDAIDHVLTYPDYRV